MFIANTFKLRQGSQKWYPVKPTLTLCYLARQLLICINKILTSPSQCLHLISINYKNYNELAGPVEIPQLVFAT